MSKVTNCLHVFAKRLTDATAAKSAAELVKGKAYAQLSKSNLLKAQSLRGIAEKISSEELLHLSQRLERLAQSQAKTGIKQTNVGVLRLQLSRETATRWVKTTGDIIKRAYDKAGKARKLVLLPLAPTLAYKTEHSVKADERVKDAAAKFVQCSTGDFDENASSALVQLTSACLSREQTAGYWARLYLSFWKFGTVHVLPRCRARAETDRVGNIITWSPEVGSCEGDWAESTFPQFYDLQRHVYTRFLTAANAGECNSTVDLHPSASRFVCRSVRDQLVRAFEVLSICPQSAEGRLVDIFAGAAERVFALDWHQAADILATAHHNSALCDPAVCEFDIIARAISADIWPFKDSVDDLSIHARTAEALDKCVSRVRDKAQSAAHSGRYDGYRSCQRAAPKGVRDDDPPLTAPDGGSVSSGSVSSAGAQASPVCTGRGGVPSKAGVPRPDQVNSNFQSSHPSDKIDAGGSSVGGDPRGLPGPQSGGSPAVGGAGRRAVDGPGSSGGERNAETVKQCADHLVDDQSSEKRLEQSAGVVNGQNAPRKIATTVGETGGNVLSEGDNPKKRRKNKPRALSNTAVPGSKEGDDACKVPGPDVELGRPRGLCAQPVEGGEGASPGGDTTDRSGSDDVTPPCNHGAQLGVAPTTGCQLGSICGGIPEEAAKTIRESVGGFAVHWVDAQGCHYKLVREDGKATDCGQRRRPSHNTDAQFEVPPRFQSNDQTSGARTHQHCRPSEWHAPNRQRAQPGRASGAPKGHVGHENGPGGPKPRPVTVGHACPGPATTGGNSPVPATHQRPIDNLVQSTAPFQPVFYQQAYPVQSGGRRHEWGYDDSSWQLYCSYCDSTNLSRGVVQRCFRRRRDACVGSAYQPYLHPSREGFPGGSGSGSSAASAQGLDERSRRRGRSRGNYRGPARRHGGEIAPAMVDGPRPLVESGRPRNQLGEHRVLPTQTFYRHAPSYNGPQPVQGYTQILPSHGEVHRGPTTLFADSVYGQGHVAQAHPGAWPIFPGASQSAWSWPYGSSGFPGVQSHQQQFALPAELYTRGVEAAGPANSGGGGSVPYVENVGHYTHGPDVHGELGN